MSGNQSQINYLLTRVCQSDESLQGYIDEYASDISPCKDDKPYFYKVYKGIPDEYLWLLVGIAGFNFLIVWLPFNFIKRRIKQYDVQRITFPLAVFSCIGVGFMLVEVSLFQKLVLYLGSPTISLSILLSSLLVGMGTGSYFGKKIYEAELRKRLFVVSISIVVAGILLFLASPYFLTKCLEYGLAFRSTMCFLMILPLAFLLGIPFPTCIQLLKRENKEKYVPWLYGVNGSMSVMGSVLAVILSMLFGFTPTYFVGLSFYLSIFLLLFLSSKQKIFNFSLSQI